MYKKPTYEELEQKIALLEAQAREQLLKEREKVQKAIEEIKQLSGLLPICSSCKKIRDDKGYWNQIESYISAHSEAQFSHSICPDCARTIYPEFDLYSK